MLSISGISTQYCSPLTHVLKKPNGFHFKMALSSEGSGKMSSGNFRLRDNSSFADQVENLYHTIVPSTTHVYIESIWMCWILRDTLILFSFPQRKLKQSMIYIGSSFSACSLA